MKSVFYIAKLVFTRDLEWKYVFRMESNAWILLRFLKIVSVIKAFLIRKEVLEVHLLKDTK